MKKIIMDALYGDAKLNHLMHATDVFESFKQLATYRELTLDVTFNDDEIERAQKTIDHVVNALKSTNMNVVFVSIRTIDNTPVKMNNYIMPNISVISSGNKWFMFNEFLNKIGYRVETNEHMQVLSAELEQYYINEKL
jgi:hypothetical protein